MQLVETAAGDLGNVPSWSVQSLAEHLDHVPTSPLVESRGFQLPKSAHFWELCPGSFGAEPDEFSFGLIKL